MIQYNARCPRGLLPRHGLTPGHGNSNRKLLYALHKQKCLIIIILHFKGTIIYIFIPLALRNNIDVVWLVVQSKVKVLVTESVTEVTSQENKHLGAHP